MLSTRCSCHFLRKLHFSPKIFEKYPNIKFHENPSSECCVMHADGQKESLQTDMTKLKVALPSFANASENQ